MNHANEFTITINNPVTELRKDLLPDDKGVYFICSAQRKENGNYLIIRLLYIGRSNDVKDRVNGKHHKHNEILKECKQDNGVPVYYYGSIEPDTNEDIARVEAALIFSKNPILNDTANKGFHHPNTRIVLKRSQSSSQSNKKLPKAFGDTVFLVCRTEK